MSQFINIEIGNKKEVIDSLNYIKEGSGDAIKKALVKTGLLIQSAAKLRLRQRGHYITGRLASSIHSEVKEGVLSTSGKVTGKVYSYSAEKTGEVFTNGEFEEKVEKELELFVGTNVEYALRIENGFNGEDKIGRVYRQSGDPFMRFAAELGDAKIGKYVEKQIERLIVEAADNALSSKKYQKKWDKMGATDYEAYYE